MTWTAANIPDQAGRTAIVTGANSGIGLEQARALAANGAHVTLACRNKVRGEGAIASIRGDNPKGSVELALLDLGDLRSVRDFAATYAAAHDRLDLLINNAGVMMPPFARTPDGFELQFGTNHLGHFALTGLLLPLLDKAPGARIVILSSLAARQGRIDFANLNAEKGYTKFAAYSQSKLANLMFAKEFQRRLADAGSGAISLCAHPGWTATNLQAHSAMFRMLNPLFGMAPPRGALATLYAATAPEAQAGGFYGPNRMSEMRGYPGPAKEPRWAQDGAVAKRLWAVSEELTGLAYLS